MSQNQMGVIGRQLGRVLGRGLGSLAGESLGKFTGIGADKGLKIGDEIGGDILGTLIPFKKGGKVKKTGPIYAHKGEYVLPAGVKPTKAQLKAVSKKKAYKKRSHKKRK